MLNALRHRGDRQIVGTESRLRAVEVLNALRHRGDRQGEAIRYIRIGLQVLNALRHRGDRQSVNKLGRVGAPWCSTPYGIVATGKRPGDDQPDQRRRVLNALRHRGDRQMMAISPLSGLPWCSTPYGIVATGKRSSTASMWAVFLCSTPYGIVATGKLAAAIHFFPPHQCSTPYGIVATGKRTAGAPRARPARAQRLTASWRQAIGGDRPLAPQARVLNALRHRGDRQLADGFADEAPHPVLNALRHRGDRQSPPRVVKSRVPGVLNALRHRGDRQESAPGRQVPGARRAQRLTASWRQARAPVLPFTPPRRDVLNALRHRGDRQRYCPKHLLGKDIGRLLSCRSRTWDARRKSACVVSWTRAMQLPAGKMVASSSAFRSVVKDR